MPQSCLIRSARPSAFQPPVSAGLLCQDVRFNALSSDYLPARLAVSVDLLGRRTIGPTRARQRLIARDGTPGHNNRVCFTPGSVCGPRFCSTRTAYTPVRRASEIRSVPASTASRCSSRRSNDGQTILRAIPPTCNKPLTCTSGRDGGIRTRGLLLPKPIREAACHGCGTPDLHSIVRWCPLASSLAAVIVIDLVTRPVRVLGRPGRSTTDP